MIKWFKEISKEDIASVGGKGANLGEMFNIGLPVPPGFVVTAQTYEKFINETKIKDDIFKFLEGLNIEDNDKLQQASKDIEKLIVSTEIPGDIINEIKEAYSHINVDKKTKAKDIVEPKEEFIAARSSATAEDLPEASFAGQQATFLNVKGKDDVVDAVRKCWASLFTARAIYYREKNNFPHEKVLIAVVVQKMVNSDKSGVMFTVNPATNKGDEVVIEAVYGLGEAIVGGAVNPDLYIVDKKSRDITTTEVKEQTWGYYKDEETGKTTKKDIPKAERKMQVINNKEVK